MQEKSRITTKQLVTNLRYKKLIVPVEQIITLRQFVNNMNISDVFELIRKEQAVFFVGSGMSRYAGYPVGAEFAGILYQSLTSEEQKEIDEHAYLPELAEEFIRIKNESRLELNGLLKDHFLKRPGSIKYHQLIASIPHIKTIITTNYDNLFELAYGPDALKIVLQSDIGKINGSRQEIFKIHGDLDYPDSIIISKTDYRKFFGRNESNSLYWSVITERIAHRSIVFIGYDVEDPNVLNLLEKIWDALGENRKDAFLIAPGQKRHKIQRLSSMGIQYIDSIGELFIGKLYNDIKQNIFADYDKKLVRIETFTKFLFKNNIACDFKALGDELTVASIKGTEGPMKGQLNLSFKDKTSPNQFFRFINGEDFGGRLEFDENHLENLRIMSSGINLLGDASDFKISFMSRPVIEGLADVIFDDGFEFQELSYEIFTSPRKIQVKASYKKMVVKITHINTANQNQADLEIDMGDYFENSLDALNVCKLLHRFTSGVALTIFPHNNELKHRMTPAPNLPMAGGIKQSLDFYELLKKVETGYKMRFRNIGYPNKEICDACNLALTALNEQGGEFKCDGTLEFEMDETFDVGPLIRLHNEHDSIKISQLKPEIIEIFGQQIDLGYKTTEFKNISIVNLEDILNKKTNAFKGVSLTKTAVITYQKTPG